MTVNVGRSSLSIPNRRGNILLNPHGGSTLSVLGNCGMDFLISGTLSIPGVPYAPITMRVICQRAYKITQSQSLPNIENAFSDFLRSSCVHSCGHRHGSAFGELYLCISFTPAYSICRRSQLLLVYFLANVVFTYSSYSCLQQPSPPNWKRSDDYAPGWKRSDDVTPGWKRTDDFAPGWKREEDVAPGWRR